MEMGGRKTGVTERALEVWPKKASSARAWPDTYAVRLYLLMHALLTLNL